MRFPLIDPQMLRFCRWIANYYLYPLGEVMKTGLPPGLQLKSELILSLTENGRACLIQGDLDSVQEQVFKEIERCRKVSLKKILKIIPGRGVEVSTFFLEEKGPSQH